MTGIKNLPWGTFVLIGITIPLVYISWNVKAYSRTHKKAHERSSNVPYVKNGWNIKPEYLLNRQTNAHNIPHNHEPNRGLTLPVWMYPVEGNVIPLGSTSMSTSNSTSHPKSIFQAGRMIGSTSVSTSSSSAHPKMY